MTGGLFDGNIFRGLAFRVLVFLTLALLPFGLISVFQTTEVARQAASNAKLSLIGLTNQAANSERAIMLEAFGAAQSLGKALLLSPQNAQDCSAFLSNYIDAMEDYVFAGFVPLDGRMVCSSVGGVTDFSESPEFEERMARQRRHVESTEPVEDMQSLITISHPVLLDDVFQGYMVLSLHDRMISSMIMGLEGDTQVDLVTFNRAGEFVRSNKRLAEIEPTLPANRSLKALVGANALVFRGDTESGEERIFAIVPIVSDVIYSMSIWHPEDVDAGLGKSISLSVLLPILMWLASLVVAFWSLNRLAIRHIKKLGRQMRHFAFNRRVPRTTMGQGVPRELIEIQGSFVRMADSIVRDEAALEDSLRDKNILLKEVHHRVKNNLQLISSMMNMQIRRAETDDARAVLKRLQDRVLSLATVHKNLYQNEALDRVDAGILLEEIIGQLLRMGLSAGQSVDVQQSYASIQMDPDDAAPLTLLASEALTNAMKYIGAPSATEAPLLTVSLSLSGDDKAVFSVSNTTSGAPGSEGTGLGTQLISAFARQLNGHVEVNFEDNVHALVLTFPIRRHVKDRYDF